MTQYQAALAELGQVFERLNDARVDMVVERLAAARRIVVSGAGRERLQCMGLAMRLLHMGLEALGAGDAPSDGGPTSLARPEVRDRVLAARPSPGPAYRDAGWACPVCGLGTHDPARAPRGACLGERDCQPAPLPAGCPRRPFGRGPPALAACQSRRGHPMVNLLPCRPSSLPSFLETTLDPRS